MMGIRNIFLIFFILGLGIFSLIIYCHHSCFAEDTYGEGELVTLYVGEIRVFPVDNATRIAISNPEVADAQSVSKDEILIMAKGEGITSLIWWDNVGQHALQLQVFLENLRPVKERVDRLIKELNLPDVYTVAADSEGKVLLLGAVKTTEDLEQIDTALGALKDKTTNLIKIEEERASVEIEIQVLELKKDATQELGFTPPTYTTLTEPTGKWSRDMKGIPDALFHLTDWTRTTFSATLDFLIQEGKGRVLSRPRLVCQSGKEAELLVGGEKPVLTTDVSEGGATTEVEYKEYGIKLKIRPKVIPENKIHVGLEVEVSEVGTAEILGTTAAPTARAYPLTKRNTSTELIMNNGQTLAISGLIKQKTEEELRKFPWLGDIPILGIFFRGKDVKLGGGRGEFGDTELVITLTPAIIEEGGLLPGAIPPYHDELEKELVKAERKTYPREAESGVDGYTLRVMKRIRDNFIYPPEAYENGVEGSVELSLRLSSTGELLEVQVTKSSNWSILDDNAVGIIKRISPFPPFPPDIGEKELWINIPIAYNIE